MGLNTIIPMILGCWCGGEEQWVCTSIAANANSFLIIDREQKTSSSSSKIGPEMQSKTTELQIEFTLISSSYFLALVPPLAAHRQDFNGPICKNNDCWVSFALGWWVRSATDPNHQYLTNWEQHSTISCLTDQTTNLSLFFLLHARHITTFIKYQQWWYIMISMITSVNCHFLLPPPRVTLQHLKVSLFVVLVLY